jgi:hypothetical protein
VIPIEILVLGDRLCDFSCNRRQLQRVQYALSLFQFLFAGATIEGWLFPTFEFTFEFTAYAVQLTDDRHPNKPIFLSNLAINQRERLVIIVFRANNITHFGFCCFACQHKRSKVTCDELVSSPSRYIKVSWRGKINGVLKSERWMSRRCYALALRVHTMSITANPVPWQVNLHLIDST